jgi:uncharacterized protein (TIGR03437 family)
MRGLLFLIASLAAAQNGPGPALSVDAGAARHAISPDIYGVNFYWDLGDASDPNHAAYAAAGPDVRATVRRWGGSSCSEYHWQFDVSNVDVYWFFEILPDLSMDASKLPEGGYFNQFADQARATGGKILSSVAMLGWLPKARAQMCSFSENIYGYQCKMDSNPLLPCGNGIRYDPACGDPTVADGKAPQNPSYIHNNPADAYVWHDESFQAAWIQYLVSRYGQGNQGGVAIWDLDNEPIWWDSDHRDIHPNPYTYDELLAADLKYAQAIKQADPTALVAGPVGDNWASLWFSKADIVAGWSTASGNYWSNPVDRNAHGGMALLPWYLQQFQSYERQHGTRLLDYLDQHAYLAPANVAFASAGDSATQALRLRSTRVFWDPNYLVSGDYWIRDVDNNGATVAPYFIPRLRQMIGQYYPGTKLAFTEYNWGALDDINGGLAQADLLGIFGREGLDLATLWDPGPVPKPALFSPPTPPGLKPTDPGAFAFKIYRNYDGIGGTFGETGVQATTGDPDQLSIFAAQRSDAALTILVLNKTTGDLSSTVQIANFTAAGGAQVWRYGPANLNAILRQQPDAALNGGSITAAFPAYSMTLFVIPAAQPGPKPVVQAVTNAASYQKPIAPGQMVVVWGTNLGPQQLDSQIGVGLNGVVASAMNGVRILFDGVPAPIVYVSQGQCSAVVPYLAAFKPVVNVQVEYQGVRSDPFQVAVVPAAPALFTLNAQGSGQAAMQDQDGRTQNSAQAPAHAGEVVVLWATGEGVTDPPGVDGRLATNVYPKPVATCAAEIGGLAASIEYCGAAPLDMPGLFQVNARMDAAVAAGDAVPVLVTIGGTPSQSGVTLVVR